ncbi:hypothetical protein EFS38_00495 [Dickeya undicola]|uniref:Secreted protein n=1 Tax=Dickeya undicola TaxID=1577887 RepID=A0ABX9X1D1_9GAMM|nr:hypothetical protein EFS38_00495 [Dickeya undicola]
MCDRGVLRFSFGVACLVTLSVLLLYLTRQRAVQSVVSSDERPVRGKCYTLTGAVLCQRWRNCACHSASTLSSAVIIR